MNIFLESCPFCGYKSRLSCNMNGKIKYEASFSVSGIGTIKGCPKKINKKEYFVVCNKCKASVGPYSSEKSAVKAWNRRKGTEENKENKGEENV